MEFIEINDITYAYKQYQDDMNLPSLLMLHGFMGDHRVFDHLINELCEFCNPITVDLLGYGRSSKSVDPGRHQERHQIVDLLSLIDELKLENPLLYGYSMGGRMALKVALARPNCFEGLILESANCGIMDKRARTKRRQIDESRAKKIESDFNHFLSEWETLDLFQSPLPTDKELTQKYHCIQSEQMPAILAASLRGFGTGSMKPVCNELSKFEHPVLLLAGTADEKYQRINNDLVQRFPNAIFKSIKAGHRVHLDNSADFLTELKNFFHTNKKTSENPNSKGDRL